MMTLIDEQMDSHDGGATGLADEISDVIEEHGRGLDAEGISSTIEAVLEEHGKHDGEPEISHAALERELSRFVEQHGGELERAEVLEVLEELAGELREGSLEPEVDVTDRAGVHVVKLAFDCAFALERAIPRLFDIRGYFIEADLSLTYLDEIGLRILATRIDESVELEGCVTRTAPNGFTIQMWQPSVEVEQNLRSLPEKMRATRV